MTEKNEKALAELRELAAKIRRDIAASERYREMRACRSCKNPGDDAGIRPCVYHERQGFQERFAVDDPRGNPIAKEVLRIVDEADR